MTYSIASPYAGLGGSKIIQDRNNGFGHGWIGSYERNDFGSKTPILEDDPDWRGFSVPEDLRITPL
jgi:hypothetical protein